MSRWEEIDYLELIKQYLQQLWLQTGEAGIQQEIEYVSKKKLPSGGTVLNDFARKFRVTH
jgi:hypothetical protein